TATQKTPMMLAPIARPTGEGGVSVISSAAGRNAISCSRRRTSFLGNGTMLLLADVMDSRLKVMQLRVAPIGKDQFVMGPVLHEAASIDRDDPVGIANGREPMGDDEDRPAGGDTFHVLLDGPLAFVV